MAYNTKLRISDNRVDQCVGDILTLSGCTKYYQDRPPFTDNRQLIDKQYVDENMSSGITASTIYNLLSPAAISVGGIGIGTVLTGKTSNEILQDMLFPEICGNLIAPITTNTVLNPSTTPREVGFVISSMSVTSNFSRGSINPQACSASPYRSGLANTYTFTGAQIAGANACTANSAVKTVTNYTVIAGANTWGSSTTYDAGAQPISNKGNNFSSPLPAGTTAPKTATITGIYPYFYGKLSNPTRPVVTNGLVTSGTKSATNAGTCTSMNFNATGEWTWFALPASCADRKFWCETDLSRGSMDTSPSDKYPDKCTISISSSEGCWNNISYNVYMSGTVGDVGLIALSSYLIP